MLSKRKSKFNRMFCLLYSFSVFHITAMAIRNPIQILEVTNEERKKYGSGCELLSMVNLLKTYGFKVNADDFFRKYFICQTWSEKDKRRPNPNYCYPGDPRQVADYGCGYGIFSQGLAACLTLYLKSISYLRSIIIENNQNIKYKIIVKSNIDTDTLIEDYVNKGYPVFIWCTQPKIDDINELNPNKPVELKESGGKGNSWIIHHNDKVINRYKSLKNMNIVNSMKELEKNEYTWIRGEHCALLIGSTSDAYIINDPFIGNVYVKKSSLDKNRKIFGNQMVCMKAIKRGKKPIRKSS